ncbi:MAG: efflux RND transporter periplasmic adaptor subunit [Limisphaerales bacterium]
MISNIKKRLTISAIVVAVAGGVLWVADRSHAESAENPASDSSAMPIVAVAKVARENLSKTVTIPAEFRPYEEVVLHAKVSGYVDKMNVDFGDKVKAGELLATLEVPELQDELNNAVASEEKAEVDYTNAHLIYTRLLAVNRAHPNLIAEQDLDTAQANAASADAAIAAARADVQKFQTLRAYTKIFAPFDGVITHRYADPGALIQAGTSSDTQSLPLVRVSDNYLLRLDFPVDVDYVQDINVGDAVNVTIESLGKTLTGAISRFTRDVDDDTRTMTAELEVPNPNLEIVPGMYASVTLQVQKRPQALSIPIEAVVAGSTPMVYVVNPDDQIREQPVQLGMETANLYQVLSGLQEGEFVVIGDHSNLQTGEKVQPKLIELSMLTRH